MPHLESTPPKPYDFQASLLARTFSRPAVTAFLIASGLILLAAIWRASTTDGTQPLAYIQGVTWFGAVALLLFRKRLRIRVVTAWVIALVGLSASIGAIRLGIVGAGFEVLLLWAIIVTFAYGSSGATFAVSTLAIVLSLSAFVHLTGIIEINAAQYLSRSGWTFHLLAVLGFAGGAIYLVERMRADLDDSMLQLNSASETNARLERQLGEARKLKALEQMAAGVAHDFGNTMTSARYALEQLQKRLANDDRASELVRASLASLTQGIELVDTLRAYGTPQPPPKATATDLCQSVRDVIELRLATRPQETVVDLDLPNDPQFVSVPYGSLCRLILNLYLNADEALIPSRRGRIRISVLPAEAPADPKSPAGMHATLLVEDNGRGFDDRVKARMFDPYVSTKDLKGDYRRGLGLAIVRSILDQADAEIDIQSTPGKGTRIAISLPVASPPEANRPEAEEAPAPHGEVLVVEDSRSVADWIVQVAEDSNLSATWFADPLAALRELDKDPGRYALACIDMHLPKITGLTLSTWIRDRRADLPIMILTGDNRLLDASVQDGLPLRTSVVTKPCTGDQLASRMLAMIQGASRRCPEGEQALDADEQGALDGAPHKGPEQAVTEPCDSRSSLGTSRVGPLAPILDNDVFYYGEALKACTQGVAVLRRGRFEYMNSAHARIYGYESVDELLGKNWQFLYSADETARFATLLAELAPRSRWSGEAVGTRRDGSPVNVRVTLTALDAETLICVCDDISDHKQVEDSLEETSSQLEVLLQSINAGTWAWDVSKQELRIDAQCSSLLRIPAGVELTRDQLFGLLDAKSRAAVDRILTSAIRPKKAQRLQCSGVRYDGTRANWNTWWTVRRTGPHRTWVARGLIVDRGAASSVSNLRDELHAVLAHELNTPLTSIRGFVDLLQTPGLPDAKRERYTHIVRREVVRLTQLVHNISQLQRLDTEGHFWTQGASDLADAIDVANRTALQITGERDRVRLIAEADLPNVCGNAATLQCILSNLLINAYKFSHSDTSVIIRAFTDGGRVLVQIVDEGLGIDRAELSRVFDPFYRGDSSERAAQAGSGLGLTVASAVAQAIGSSIELSSTPGVGTSVTVVLTPEDSDDGRNLLRCT